VKSRSEGNLQSALGPVQFLTIGLGTMIGIAWAVVLGDWLNMAAPMGAIIGFVIGGLGMMLIAACYAELATALPRAGADVIYVLEVFGPRAAFIVGWFLVLMAITVTSFEAIALAWFFETLFPAMTKAPHVALGSINVNVFSASVQIFGMILLIAANYRGAQASSRIQDVATFTKAAGAFLFLAAAFSFGDTANIAPVLTPANGKSFIWGTLWIAATAPIWFSGFQIIPQAIEERREGMSLRTIGVITVSSIMVGVIFYSLIVIAASMTMPWQTLAKAPMPAFAAIDAAFSMNILSKAVIAAVILGIIATWNACFLWAIRLLLGMARNGLIPESFMRINRFGAPGFSTLFAGAIGIAGLALGREGLIAIINMAAMSLALSFAACCYATFRLRKTRPDLERPFRTPGGRAVIGLATIVAVVMALAAVLEPLSRSRTVPIEWILLTAWGGAGFLVWHFSRRKGSAAAKSEVAEVR
jgi:APA family basic amino acid/polyamine antiporter